MQNKLPSAERRKLSPLKIISYAGVAAGTILLLGVVVILLFANPILNSFIKPGITKAFGEAYPACSIRIGGMNYNLWNNRVGCDTIIVETGEWTCSIASFSVKGISRMNMLRQNDLSPYALTRAVMDAGAIVLNFHQAQSVLQFGVLHLSVPDSEMVVDSIRYFSLLDDESFFMRSRFKQTRFRFDIPQLNISGLDYPALLHGNIYNAKSITIHDMLADILVDMDKPDDKNSSQPQMPGEALSSMKELVNVDNLKITNGRLKYYERHAVKAKPALLTFDHVNLSISGIANHTALPETAVVRGEGLLMNSGPMNLDMVIPLTPGDFSLQYSGSLGRMDVTKLNPFIEPSEHQRIKSGIVQSAAFTINVLSGHASGTLRLEYKDLSVSVLNKDTGSENGIFNRISTLIGKIFVIHGSNMPDEKGRLRVGVVKYTKHPREYFFQFLWFALRNSMTDVVGFPRIASD